MRDCGIWVHHLSAIEEQASSHSYTSLCALPTDLTCIFAAHHRSICTQDLTCSLALSLKGTCNNAIELNYKAMLLIILLTYTAWHLRQTFSEKASIHMHHVCDQAHPESMHAYSSSFGTYHILGCYTRYSCLFPIRWKLEPSPSFR